MRNKVTNCVIILSLMLVGQTVPTLSFAQAALPISACKAQLPFGEPKQNDSTKTTVNICRHAYVLNYDENAKIPDWVSYTLTPFDSIGCGTRSNKFVADLSLDPKYQSKLSDYESSGYDRGHIAPDDDMRWDETAERESFILSNMTPQLPSFNRGIWGKLEQIVRDWSQDNMSNLTIYAGPIYNIKSDKKIGDGHVDVPTGFYKIIVNDDTKKVIAFKFDDQETANADTVESHLSSVQDIEKVTNISFPLPASVDKSKVGTMWPYDRSIYTKNKKAACAKK